MKQDQTNYALKWLWRDLTQSPNPTGAAATTDPESVDGGICQKLGFFFAVATKPHQVCSPVLTRAELCLRVFPCHYSKIAGNLTPPLTENTQQIRSCRSICGCRNYQKGEFWRTWNEHGACYFLFDVNLRGIKGRHQTDGEEAREVHRDFLISSAEERTVGGNVTKVSDGVKCVLGGVVKV